MKVKKFLKGLMAAALAVTMAVTPVSAVKAAEVTVKAGAATYAFSETPVAAFVVTGFFVNDEGESYTTIFYCVPEGTKISAQNNLGICEQIFANEGVGYDGSLEVFRMDSSYKHDIGESVSCGHANSLQRYNNLPYVWFTEFYQEDLAGDDSILVTIYTEGDDLSVIPELFAGNGATAVQIPVADALAMNNANVQLDTANTQTADAQAQADALAAQAQAQADALAAQQAADAQAAAQVQADAQAAAQAQQAADAAVQAQITAQPDSTAVSQGTYTVEANDNLCKIAEKVYGDRKAWKEIYKANPTIKSDYVIYKGQVLVIPAR